MRGSAHRTLTFGLSVRVAEQNRRGTWKSEWIREEKSQKQGDMKRVNDDHSGCSGDDSARKN